MNLFQIIFSGDEQMSLDDVKALALAGILVGGLGIAVTGPFILPHLDRDVYVAKVTDKQVKRSAEKDKYLIFTEEPDGDVRVFENTDSLLEWKWDSSNLYGKIRIGETYRIKTYGWRVPFLSWYENIVDVEKVQNAGSRI